jgi:NAD(P)H-nitrite reductase large subunit
MNNARYLIIGNGAAGVSAAEIIRRRDPAGQITIVTDEPYRLYSRPGIAYLLLGQVSEQQIISRSEAFYRQHRLELRFGDVRELDLQRQRAYLADGGQIPYDVLLLATGALAVPPTFPGHELEGVLTFDTLDNAKRVVQLSRRAKAAVIIGGGITAMELAEGINRHHVRTHLLQRQERIWPKLFDQRESAIIAAQIEHEGIHIHYREAVNEVIGRNGKVAGVQLKSGGEIKCQIVGVAIGVQPNMRLVKGQPVEQDRGILVNDYMQSSVPTVFAAGDIAQVYDRWTGQHQLDILWPSAINEGRAAGFNMVDLAHGRPLHGPYDKGTPFNAALLFGVHLTVIGRVGSGDARNEDDLEELSYLSRGSSQVWTAPFRSSYRSAWDHAGASSVRIVLSGNKIVGALLLGNQQLADPLREMVEAEVDMTPYTTWLLEAAPDALPAAVLRTWRQWRQQKVAAARV